MLDHLVYATCDLDATARDLGDRLGVVPAPGGRHVGRGTRNYLLGLGGDSYLEIIGPDPEQTDFTGVRPFGLDSLERPRLVGWAARVTGIERTIEESREKGYDPGPVRSMSRRTPDGELLSWKLTDVPGTLIPALLPFLIDWDDSPHPSQTSPAGVRLVGFQLESPDPVPIGRALRALGANLMVHQGEQPRLVATVVGPNGELQLD